MARSIVDRSVHVCWIVCAAIAIAAPARAAPQVLALIATDQPVALRCDATQCRAELPTLCLQPDRRAPEAGRAYRLAQGRSLTLSGKMADGRVVTVPLNGELGFEARRTHVAVEAIVSRDAIDRYGIGHPSLSVGEDATVVPVAVAGDAWPQSADEIAAAVGPHRALVAALVDRDGERMPAVRLANRLINALPATGRADRERSRQLWTRMLGDAARSGVSASALERARFNVDQCTTFAQDGLVSSLRHCLQGRNDGAMDYLNYDLEPALKTGS